MWVKSVIPAGSEIEPGYRFQQSGAHLLKIGGNFDGFFTTQNRYKVQNELYKTTQPFYGLKAYRGHLESLPDGVSAFSG
jgi:hypothetical protein